ncbi:DNA-binding protein [Bacteroides thetaiotaomicron]|nr:DNA-binding protein [Bacteroides thetaiotaomicron]
MAMTVSYSVVPRKNPAKKSEPAKYYAQAQASGELDFEELCEAITSRSTCTETDVRAAISGILYEVKRALKAGRIARLGDLGSLQIGLNSEGAASVKEFSGSMIKGAHLIFRPGKTLVELMKILSYQQVQTRAVAQAGAGDGGEKTLTRIRIPVVMAPVMKRLRTLRYNWQTGQGNNELE